MTDLKEAKSQTELEAKRAELARQSLRQQVDVIKNGTPMAAGPLVLNQSVYTSETRFQAEKKHVFLNQPLVAGLSGDIPNPGDMLVFDAAGPSILVMRGKDGIVRAFLNMCTHRGAKLVEDTEPWSGHSKTVSCPFHAWTFSTSGQLMGQPGKEGFAGCDISARNLIEAPCSEYLGIIFVRANRDSEPIDAKAHLGGFAERLELLELGRAQSVKKGILYANSNWKFALDTYGESYHFSTLHKSSIAKVNYNNKCVYEAFGPHHRVQFPKFFVGDLVEKPESEWPEIIYSGVHFLFPNTVIYFGAINPGEFFTQVFRLFPDGVGKTRCHFAVYAPFGIESEKHRQICETTYDLTAKVVVEEDYRVASNGYANLVTAPDDFDIVIGANEIALHHFHQDISKIIGMPLDKREA